MIESWSFSRLEVYEACPYRAYLQYVQKIPVPEPVPGPEQQEHPLVRGLRVHTAAEAFVTRTEDVRLIDELQVFNDAFHQQRACYLNDPKSCVVEAEWAITRSWERTGWSCKDAWGRMKLDWGYVYENDELLPCMDIVDYKTGKKYPPKHIQQGQLYALVGSIYFPDVEKFNVSFWYLDQGETLDSSYSKLQVQVFQDGFDRRARAMTAAVDFPPRTSSFTCRFCPYGEGRDGNKYCDFRYSFSN